MDNMRHITKFVREALACNPATRNSDSYLYYVICNAKLKANGYDISKVTLADALLNREELGLPIYESVRRARQKVQASNPDLAGTDEVEAMRAIHEEAFRKYAKEVDV